MKTRENNMELLVIAALLASAALGLYLYLFAGVKSKNERVSVLVSEIENQTKQEAVLQSIRDSVVETRELREKLGAFFVEDADVVSFIELVERLAAENSVALSIESVDTDSLPDGAGGQERLLLTISAEGGWRGVFAFFSLLELLPLQTEIKQARLAAKEKAPGQWRSDVTLAVLKLKGT